MNGTKNLITIALVLALGVTGFVLFQKVRNVRIINSESFTAVESSSNQKLEIKDIKVYEYKNAPAINVYYDYSFDEELEQRVLELLNEYRKENGLKELIQDEMLSEMARWKSNALLQNNYFSHKDEKHGYTPEIINSMHGSLENPFFQMGENLHYSTKISIEAQNILDAWKNSEAHNGNLLNPSWSHVGIGIVQGAESGSKFNNQRVTLSSQVFGQKNGN